MTVQYTPGQLRKALNVSPETYRHWKKSLPPLRQYSGRSPQLTSGDLLAVAVVRVLCVDIGVRVSAIAECSDALFLLCNSSPWPVLERGKLLFDLAEARVRFHEDRVANTPDGPYVVVPLGKVIACLRDELLTGREGEFQHSLRFPPAPIGGVATATSMGGRT